MTLLRSHLLGTVPWIDHGFGTRHGGDSQDGMASLQQIHSERCLIVAAPGCAGEGDALITDRPGVPVSVRTADCFPILLADLRRRTVAAIHAGWRGTAARIVSVTIGRMRTECKTDPADIVAAIGPGIGACCYEVGEEVAQRFGRRAGHLDLAGANRAQLVEAGVPEGRIEVLGLCTLCEPARFHSYRRDGEAAGRMVSFIAL